MNMEQKNLDYLRRKLDRKKDRVKLRYDFYEMKKHATDKGILIPSWLKAEYRSTVGWCAKSVDSLSDRLNFDGFEDDAFNAMRIFEMNNPDIYFDAVIREALIGACSFTHIAHGEGDENIPRLSVLTAIDATGIMDEQTGLLKEGYAILDRDHEGRPILEAYYTPTETVYIEHGEMRTEQNPTGYPLLVPAMFRPDSRRPFGHSRISRACMYYQRLAETTLERSEVSAEFYSFPQKYVTGLDPDAQPLDTWRATISAMLRFDKDESGDSPKLGQFTQQSMQPFIDQLRMCASLFAGETGMTMDDMGFPQNNPSSAEAIKASHDTLGRIARRAQKNFGTAFANVGYLSACLRDNTQYRRSMIATQKPIWAPIFEPDASALSIIGDGASKLNSAVPGYINAENLRQLTGIETAEAIGIEEAENE